MKKKKKATTKKTTVTIKETAAEKKSKKETPKTTLKPAQKSKEIKKVKAKTEKKKAPLKTTKKVAKKKITEKPKKKVEAKKKEVKVKVKAKVKIKEKPKKEKVKAEVKVKIKKKEIKKVVAKKEKKPKKVAPAVTKKVKPEKIIEKPEKKIKAKKVSLPRKALLKKPVKVLPLIERKPEKVLRPVIEAKYPPELAEILPKGYDEDSVTLMIVDPGKLFAYWEVQKDTVASHKGILTLRVYDVTGVEFDGSNANSYSDIAVHERLGSWYLDVNSEKEFIVDIGFINPAGVFVTVARSNKVSTPRRAVAEEGALTGLYEAGPRIGYE